MNRRLEARSLCSPRSVKEPPNPHQKLNYSIVVKKKKNRNHVHRLRAPLSAFMFVTITSGTLRLREKAF